VNNAAIVGRTVPVWEFRPEDWDRVVQVNLTGVFYGTAVGRRASIS
jgi:NAD(P)-dependent dehydrogenase (short-subunit alcohol dehydrogenase family)